MSYANTNLQPNSSEHSETDLDQLIEHHVAIFRNAILRALASEKASDARYLRSYIRAVCELILLMSLDDRMTTSELMLSSEYRVIWSDFMNEVCSADSIDMTLQMTCRYALEGLWMDCLFVQPDPCHRRVYDCQQVLLDMVGNSCSSKSFL